MNTQNIPRDLKLVKAAFIPKLDGFLYADYKAIEVRLLGYFTAKLGDTLIVDQIAAGLDPHVESAKVLYGTDTPTDSQRQLAKRRNFSLIYGGGSKTLIAQGLATSYPGAKALVRAFHAAWPGVDLLSARIARTMETRGYIKTPWGRHLHPETAHKAPNALIQGSAADLMRASLINIHEHLAGYDSHLVNTVHDEAQMDVKRNELRYLVKALPALMDDKRISAVVPIDVDLEWSTTTWADKGPLPEDLNAKSVRAEF